MNMPVVKAQASSYVRKHKFHKNGKSWSALKNIKRPRYPWYEVYFDDNSYSRKKYGPSHQPTVEIMLHRKHGLNAVEFYSLQQLEETIEMLINTRDEWEKYNANCNTD